MGGSRGQIIGQVLIFILAGLVFILIVSYGYKAIQHFSERSEEVVLIDFKNDLGRHLESVKRDFGSVRKVELRLPSKFDGVCFVDGTYCPSAVSLSGRRLDWIVPACESKSANVFLVPRAVDLSFDDVEVVSPYFVCFPASDGGVVIRMEGTGKSVRVSSW